MQRVVCILALFYAQKGDECLSRNLFLDKAVGMRRMRLTSGDGYAILQVAGNTPTVDRKAVKEETVCF